ncbi:DUF4288 domain-containing protein [Akkermansiaceae bacterium]|nr:DUF4288 domain-containing protein [Akkermansiaceae bacterium]
MIYGAKSITRFNQFKDEDGDPAFEERVILLHAENQSQAIEIAEKEAIEYADKNNGIHLEWIAVYEAKNSQIIFKGTQEVYSIYRHDDSSDEDYLSYFHDTGAEKTTEYNPSKSNQ